MMEQLCHDLATDSYRQLVYIPVATNTGTESKRARTEAEAEEEGTMSFDVTSLFREGCHEK
jgi:hypothetical protein